MPASAPSVHATPMLGAKLFLSVLYAFAPFDNCLYVVGEPSSTPGLYRLPRPVTLDPGTKPAPGPVTPNRSATVAIE